MIYLCGVSNKKDKTPLQSDTITGKIVDKIAEGLECKKINFFDCVLSKPPTDKQIKNEIENFLKRIEDVDIVLLFSEKIGKHFNNKKIISVKHPSYIFQYKKDILTDYIKETKRMINEN